MNCPLCGAAIGGDARFCSQCGAPRPQLDPRFHKVEQEVARLREERESGRLSEDRYKAALKELMIEHEGRWWMLGAESGKWYVNDGQKWVEGAPALTESTRVGTQPTDANSVPCLLTSHKSTANIRDLLMRGVEIFGDHATALKTGNYGGVTAAEAESLGACFDTSKGIHFERGYLSPNFITNNENMRAEMETPHLLLIAQEVVDPRDLSPVLSAASENSDLRTLVIAHDVRGDALAALVNAKRYDGKQVVAIRADGYGDRRNAILQDIAILTGGRVIGGNLGISLDRISLQEFGRAKKAIIDEATTTIIDGAGNASDIEARIGQIRMEMRSTTSDYDREKLEERLSKLTHGVVVIRDRRLYHEVRFLMRVTDVFKISGKGWVASGRIERGQIRAGEEVEIAGVRPAVTFVVKGVVKTGDPKSAEGEAGDEVGLLLPNAKDWGVKPGHVLSTPGRGVL